MGEDNQLSMKEKRILWDNKIIECNPITIFRFGQEIKINWKAAYLPKRRTSSLVFNSNSKMLKWKGVRAANNLSLKLAIEGIS